MPRHRRPRRKTFRDCRIGRAQVPPELRDRAGNWIRNPPPLRLRIGEPTYFLGGAAGEGPRSHWMRLPRPVDGDPALQSALVTYASDYLLLDMAYRSHPEQAPVGSLAAFSVDHALWLHRPVRLDRWHLHTQTLMAIAGHRGLVRGAVHDFDGHLVASSVQEVLIRRSA